MARECLQPASERYFFGGVHNARSHTLGGLQVRPRAHVLWGQRQTIPGQRGLPTRATSASANLPADKLINGPIYVQSGGSFECAREIVIEFESQIIGNSGRRPPACGQRAKRRPKARLAR